MVVNLENYLEYLAGHGGKPKTIENYKRAMNVCKIQSLYTNELSGIWKALIEKLDLGMSYSDVFIMFALARRALRQNRVKWIKDSKYKSLETKLAIRRNVPEAFSEREVRELLSATWWQGMNRTGDYSLHRLCILLVYSGLHISSAQGVKFSDFKLIQPAGVYFYPVRYKGRRYNAAISQRAFERLKSANPHDSDLVVYQKDNAKTKFDVNFRIKMSRLIVDRGLQPLMNNKNVFESMRKFAESQFNRAGLRRNDVRLLLGLRPKSTAYKHRIDEKGKRLPLELEKRAAEAYFKTPLNTLELWK